MREKNLKHYSATMRYYGLHRQPESTRSKRVYAKSGVRWRVIAELWCTKDKATSFSVKVVEEINPLKPDDEFEQKYFFKIARFVREELQMSVGEER